MPVSKEERAAQAAKHLSFVKGVFAKETESSIQTATIYEDGEARAAQLPEPKAEATETAVTTAFAVSALHDASGKVTLVDAASFTRPGGAYEDGAFGPEQVLCSESNLYPILQGIKPAYHSKNHGYACGQLFTDRAAFLKDVVFNREGSMRTANVIVVPEPNRARALENHRSERECDACLANRIETLLNIAALQETETLIVGAFGCGRQGFPPAQVIEQFQSWIDTHQGAIPKIVFAVPRVHFEAFDAAFGAPKPAQEEVAAEPEEEEELFDPSDLPEGVTLR
ncbi:MAG: TIGR02452 family protein [Eggerthellaceae bacterium]|nr:TIGR02452 family protein [Eggerthellaceae bacterium]